MQKAIETFNNLKPIFQGYVQKIIGNAKFIAQFIYHKATELKARFIDNKDPVEQDNAAQDNKTSVARNIVNRAKTLSTDLADNHPYLTAALIVVGTIVSAYVLQRLFSSTSLSSGANHVTEPTSKIIDCAKSVTQNAGKTVKELLAERRAEYAAEIAAKNMTRS